MSSEKVERSDVSFAEATKVERLDSHTYRVNLSNAYCIGAVPNGGYTASCLLAAARTHLVPLNQPDALTAHFEYPSRTAPGPAIVVIEDVKLASHTSPQQQLSTLHLTLWQGGELLRKAPWISGRDGEGKGGARRVVLAYTTHTNFQAATGISMPTGYQATPAAALPPPPPDVKTTTPGADSSFWEETRLPPGASKGLALRSLLNWRFFLPRNGRPLTPGVLDMWIRTRSGERITQGALPYVVDSFPFNLHTFLAAEEVRQPLLEQMGAPVAGGAAAAAKEKRGKGEEPPPPQRATLWFPTVVMNLEMKKALPPEGVEWLAVRVSSKQIRDGRFDLEVLVRDEAGELVALSQHVAMILGMERNTATGKGKGKGAKDSRGVKAAL